MVVMAEIPAVVEAGRPRGPGAVADRRGAAGGWGTPDGPRCRFLCRPLPGPAESPPSRMMVWRRPPGVGNMLRSMGGLFPGNLGQHAGGGATCVIGFALRGGFMNCIRESIY